MYKIKVLHNYIYKLVEELHLRFPSAGFQVKGDMIITNNPQIVDAARYIFQFQPGLLVIEQYQVPGIEIERDEFAPEMRYRLATEILPA